MTQRDASTNDSIENTDVLLIGAGPIGLEMAVGLQDAGIDYIHLDAQQIGHTISWFPRQAHFFSSPDRIAICGVPLRTIDQGKATREDYLAYLLSIVQQFQLPIRTYERVVSLQRLDDDPERFDVITQHLSGSRHYRAQRVILAIGDMHRPRKLVQPELGPVPGSELPHVSSYFVEPHTYAFRRLLIVGGKNSAAEAALRCHRAGAHVMLCQREPELSTSIKYWLRPELEWLIRAGEIEFFPQQVPIAIHSEHAELARLSPQGTPDLHESARTRVMSDFVLLLIGYEMDSHLLAEVGVELIGPSRTPRVDPETMETNIRGLYVAGTAAAGTQLHYRLFIENCHAHVVRILRHLARQDPQHINRLAYTRLHEHPQIAES